MMNNVAKLSFLLGVCLLGAPLLAAGGADGHHGVNWTEFTAKVFNFVVFFGGLGYILKDPLRNFFTDRLHTIRESLAKAENSYTDATRQLEEIDAKMARLDEELAAIEAKAKQEIEKETAMVKARAEADADRIIENAAAEVNNMRRESERKLKAFVIELAVEEAERIIKDKVDDAERERLFQRFTERLEAQL